VGPNRTTIQSDLNIRANFSIRKNKTIIRKIVENSHQLTSGQNILAIKISADYVINNRLNIRLFFDRTLTTPYVSTSFPTANTNAGISLRFTLAQ
jgi:cell surface protein SprA